MSQEGFDGRIPIVLVPIEKGVDSPVGVGDASQVASFYRGTYRGEVSKNHNPPPKKCQKLKIKMVTKAALIGGEPKLR